MIEFYNSEKASDEVEGLIGVEANVWTCISKGESSDEVGEEDITKLCEELLKRSKDQLLSRGITLLQYDTSFCLRMHLIIS